jgi:hypothetical protein
MADHVSVFASKFTCWTEECESRLISPFMLLHRPEENPYSELTGGQQTWFVCKSCGKLYYLASQGHLLAKEGGYARLTVRERIARQVFLFDEENTSITTDEHGLTVIASKYHLPSQQ